MKNRRFWNKKLDGLHYSLYRVRGDFRSTFDFHDYPFDSQSLVLRVTNPRMTREQVIYAIDTSGLKLPRADGGVFAVFLINLRGVRAENSLPAATSPNKVVTDLYSAHRGKADPLQYPASKKLLGDYFEKGLLSLFLKDQSESKGEVGKLDFDPLYAAQDFEIKDFSVVLVSEKEDSAEVVASFKNMGTSEKIVFLLSNTAQGWRITDIKYSDGRTLKGILK